MRANYIYKLSALVMLCLLLCCACNKPQKPAPGASSGANGTPPATQEQTGGVPAADQTAQQPAEATQDSAASQQPPLATPPEPPNPRPSGSNWVWADHMNYRIGQTIKVEYTINKIGDPRPWIGLIPATVTVADEAANDAADVAYQYVETPAGTVEISAAEAGQFHIRLLSGGDKGVVLYETPLVTIQQWPKGKWVAPDQPPIKPYVTISGGELPEQIPIKKGYPVVAYWETAEAYPQGAWLGLIPTSCTSNLEGENDAVDVEYHYLDGETKGQFTFMMSTPGEYVFRIFPCDISGAEWVAESQKWQVVE